MMNRPTQIAVNGLDYLNFANRKVHQFSDLTVDARESIGRIEKEFQVSTMMLGTGPSVEDVIVTDTKRMDKGVALAASCS